MEGALGTNRITRPDYRIRLRKGCGVSYAYPFPLIDEPRSVWGRVRNRFQRTNWVAAGAALGVNAAFFAVLLSSGATAIVQPVRALSVLDVLEVHRSAPPPRPARPKEPRPVEREQPKTEIVVPVAEIQTPAFQTIVAAKEAPQPLEPPSTAAPSPTPVASMAPVSVANMNTNLLSGKPPTYPMLARRKREQGIVVLRLVISEMGRVTGIAVEQTSGHQALDDAAVSAVRKWRWSPTMRDGQPVIITGTVRIPFVLRDV